MQARLLITGGAGFIGANFVHYWIRNHPDDRVVVLDALTYAGNRASLAPVEGHPGFRFVHGDVRDQSLAERLLAEEQLDTVVHFAAESHVDRSIAGPDLFIDVNVNGTHSLLKAARSVWLAGSPEPRGRHRFHHVSTDEVYGSLEPDDPPFTERTPYAPNSPYAASKAAADHLVRSYGKTYGLLTTISNCSNNYGAYQFPEKLIPLCLVNLLEGKRLPIYGDGLNVRDWLFVEDHCRGVEMILRHGQAGETYNIGGGSELSNIVLVRMLCSLVDEIFAADPELAARFPQAPPATGGTCETLIEFVKDRPGHDRRYAIDDSYLRRSLGYRSATQLEAGLRETLLWYLEHEAWWRSVMDDSYRSWVSSQYDHA